MKILVDAFGGDNAPYAPIAGAVQAAAEGIAEVALVGDEEKICAAAAEKGLSWLKSIYSRPSRLATQTRLPMQSMTVYPWPGCDGARLKGRTMGRPSSR